MLCRSGFVLIIVKVTLLGRKGVESGELLPTASLKTVAESLEDQWSWFTHTMCIYILLLFSLRLFCASARVL